MNDDKTIVESTIESALKALNAELEKEPICPEKVSALAGAISALSSISPFLRF